MQVHFRTPELFGQAEINNVYNTCMVSNAHKDVARFQVSVNEVPGMDILEVANLHNPYEHCIGKQEVVYTICSMNAETILVLNMDLECLYRS